MKRKVNKTLLIKNFKASNPEAKPKDVAKALKRYKVSPEYVSLILSKLRTKKKATKARKVSVTADAQAQMVQKNLLILRKQIHKLEQLIEKLECVSHDASITCEVAESVLTKAGA